ncbi:MAG: CotH kinase family protein [Limisphaerales bacterium]|jgi:hypothetical protein
MIGKLIRYFCALVFVAFFCGMKSTAIENRRGQLSPTNFPINLPVVFLNTVSNKSVSGTPVPCIFRLETTNRHELSNRYGGMIRFHGATSQGYPKKSYRIVLNTPVQLLDLRRSHQWVLNAAFVDPSLMRHKLSYDLFLSLSTKDAPRYAAASRFVELFLNDEYVGVYLLMERVDRQLLNLRKFETNDFVHAVLYKAVDHSANFGQTGYAGYEQQEPDFTKKPNYWQPLVEFNSFVSTAKNEEFFDKQSGIWSKLDIENAIDFHLLVLLTSNSDGITKNYYLARDGQEKPPLTVRFFFVPWDYDGTFGRNWDGSLYPHDVWLSNNLFDRLMQNRDYRKKFAARWNELRKSQFSERFIFDMIDKNVKELGEAVKRNSERWNQNQQSIFYQDIQHIKNWVPKRLQWLDSEINRRAQD